MIVTLSLDDFSPINSRMDLLYKLKEHFDSNFKVSLFTVPIEIGVDTDDWGFPLAVQELQREVRSNLDWMQIIPHGLYHRGREMKNYTYGDTVEYMKKVEDIFNGLRFRFERGLKSPHWSWNKEVVRALNDNGWWGAIDPRQPNMPCPKKFYKYNYSIDQPFWESKEEVLKLHGHIFGTRNDLGKCFNNLLKLPKDTIFKYVTDFISEK